MNDPVLFNTRSIKSYKSYELFSIKLYGEKMSYNLKKNNCLKRKDNSPFDLLNVSWARHKERDVTII